MNIKDSLPCEKCSNECDAEKPEPIETVYSLTRIGYCSSCDHETPYTFLKKPDPSTPDGIVKEFLSQMYQVTQPIQDHIEKAQGYLSSFIFPSELHYLVAHEVNAARKKFPRNINLNVALMEEVGELAQAQLQGKERGEIIVEAIQVMGLVLRIIMETDASIEVE